MHKAFIILNGDLARWNLSRTFVDGQFFYSISLRDEQGHHQEVKNVFCTNALLDLLQTPGSKEIYIWNSHVFAIRTAAGLVDDVQGVRKSFFYRDRLLLIILAATIILLPYVLWVVLKKLSALGSLPKVENGVIVT